MWVPRVRSRAPPRQIRTRPAIVSLLVAAVTLLGPMSFAGAETVGAAGPPIPSAPTMAPTGLFGGPWVGLGFHGETGAALHGIPSVDIAVPLSTVASVVVNLPLQHPAGLQEFLRGVSDPFSPSYAHFLTLPEFTQRYAPTAEQQSMVTGYFAAQGLRVVFLAPDHLSLTVEGTLAQLQNAFHLHFGMFHQGESNFWAPVSSPELPSSVAPWVYSVVGLTDHPSALRVLAAHPSGTPVPGTGVQDYPNEMSYEFQLNRLYNATGDKAAGVVPTDARGVTIVQALWSDSSKSCGYSVSDIGNFFNNSTGYPSGLPKPVMQPHYKIPGYPGGPPASGNCSTSGLNVSNTGTQEVNSPSIELTLDQEYSGVDAPGANLAPTWVNGTGIAATNGELVALLNWIVGCNVPAHNVHTQSFGAGESPNSTGSYVAEIEQDNQTAAAMG
ncbi:MAG: hypothetical protein L3J87_02455, partial [Thermoplasmata archaeon]|nr:hypothetical protein [Thermoplasmata archaeon]